MRACKRCGAMFTPTGNRMVYCRENGCGLEVQRELDRLSHRMRSSVHRECRVPRKKRVQAWHCVIPIGTVGEPMKGKVVGDMMLVDGEWCYPVVLDSAARLGEREPDWYPKKMVVRVECEWA